MVVKMDVLMDSSSIYFLNKRTWRRKRFRVPFNAIFSLEERPITGCNNYKGISRHSSIDKLLNSIWRRRTLFLYWISQPWKSTWATRKSRSCGTRGIQTGCSRQGREGHFSWTVVAVLQRAVKTTSRTGRIEIMWILCSGRCTADFIDSLFRLAHIPLKQWEQ